MQDRWERNPNPKPLVFNPSDKRILQTLARYRYLRLDFLYALIGECDETYFRKRLRALYDHGYVNKPKQQKHSYQARYRKGIFEVNENAPQSPLLRRKHAPQEFAHQLMISDIMASIEIGVKADPSLTFIPWTELTAPKIEDPFRFPVDITHNGDRYTRDIIPDGIFQLQYPSGRKITFILEADRNTEPLTAKHLQRSSFIRKILGYQYLFRTDFFHERFGISKPFILVVTVNEKHMRNLMALEPSTRFYFKTMPSLFDEDNAPKPSPHILTDPWHLHPDQLRFINKEKIT